MAELEAPEGFSVFYDTGLDRWIVAKPDRLARDQNSSVAQHWTP